MGRTRARAPLVSIIMKDRSKRLVNLCLITDKSLENRSPSESNVASANLPSNELPIENIEVHNIDLMPSNDQVQSFLESAELSLIQNPAIVEAVTVFEYLDTNPIESFHELRKTSSKESLSGSLIQPEDLGFITEPSGILVSSCMPALDNDISCNLQRPISSESTNILQGNDNLIQTVTDSSSLGSDVNEMRQDETTGGASLVDYGDMAEGRKRKKKKDPELWKKNLNKILRMEGKTYLGYQKPKGEKIKHNNTRLAREMKPACTSTFCKKSAVRKCDSISEDSRKIIFDKFWKELSWDQRKIFVINNVDFVQKNRETTLNRSRRVGTLKYHLPVYKEDKTVKVVVCRNMFTNTLCLGPFTVQSWAKKNQSGMFPSKVPGNTVSKNSTSIEMKSARDNYIHEFFDLIPKLPSHYNRKNTNKLFLEPIYRNITHLYTIYKKSCEDKEIVPYGRKKFDEIFSVKNISIHKLKKDMCDTCVQFEAGNLNPNEYEQHIKRKNKAREEKEKDKINAMKNLCIMLNVDLQAVKVCPFMTASAIYFKTKLCMHNYSIYNVANHHTTCYWFSETEADLAAPTFASMLLDYLSRHCLGNNLPIIIYSDGCAAQKRNNILSYALLNFSIMHNITITQKYLEVGHTQMEGDSVHSCVERKLKNRTIHLPIDYITATNEARSKPVPYETMLLDFTFFRNYADPKTLRYNSIRPGKKAGEPKVTDIKVIDYSPSGIIKVKLDYEAELVDLPSRPKKINIVRQYDRLFKARLPITDTKFKHLQELKSLLPIHCHGFYDNLPYKNVP